MKKGVIFFLCFSTAIVFTYASYLVFFVAKRPSSSSYITVPIGNQVTFAVLGDTGFDSPAKNRLFETIDSRCQVNDYDGIILLGDNIYPRGVESIHDPKWTTIVEQPFDKPCLREKNIYPVLGNHDYAGNVQAQIDYSKVNPRWNMPNRFYQVDFGSLVRLLAIDSNVMEFCFLSQHCTGDFFMKSINSTEAPWTIVAAHHPIASSNVKKEFGYNGDNGTSLANNISCNKADAWLAGHSHHLEHREIPGCKTQMLVSGASGSNLSKINQDEPDSKFAGSQHGFLELNFTASEMTITFVDVEGTILYRDTLTKDAQKLRVTASVLDSVIANFISSSSVVL